MKPTHLEMYFCGNEDDKFICYYFSVLSTYVNENTTFGVTHKKPQGQHLAEY